MRLTGRARVAQPEPHPHAILCFSWSDEHLYRPFNFEERRFFVSIWEIICTTVSGCRLRTEALENVRRLQELDRLRTTFLASVNHDMRTPLGHIVALSTSILGSNVTLDEETRTDLEVIYQSAEHLRMMISDMLDYAKLEVAPSSIILNLQSVDLNSLIHEIVALSERTNPNPSVRVIFTISDSLIVQADAQRVCQIMLNLLTNALKFTSQGEVEVTARRGYGQAVICVRDTGIGIAPEDCGAIFDPFHQLHGLKANSGVGLGLSICKRLLALMGGRIWVESQLGQGSKFFFSLPLDE